MENYIEKMQKSLTLLIRTFKSIKNKEESQGMIYFTLLT